MTRKYDTRTSEKAVYHHKIKQTAEKAYAQAPRRFCCTYSVLSPSCSIPSLATFSRFAIHFGKLSGFDR